MTMSWEMLSDSAHAGLLETLDEGAPEVGDYSRIRVKCPVADNAAVPVVNVQNGREREIHTVSAQFGGEHEPHGLRHLSCSLCTRTPSQSELAHRGNRRKLLAETLHAPALVIDGNQQGRAPQRVYFARKFHQLLRICVVSGEQDDPTGKWVCEAPAVVFREPSAGDVQHDWTQR